MNTIDDDTLQAYVDAELDAATATRVDAALAHDERLARRVQQARELRAQLKAAFDPVLEEPVPAHLSALVQPAPPQATLVPGSRPPHPARRGSAARRHRASARRWVPGAAVAALLAVLAVALFWRQGNDLVSMRDGRQFAAGSLSRALDRELASAPDPHASIAIGLSFRSVDGTICRTFSRRTRPAMAGLACHQAGGWLLPVLSAAERPAGGELRQAASSLPPAVQAEVDARIKGDAFDAQQERAARAAGWR